MGKRDVSEVAPGAVKSSEHRGRMNVEHPRAPTRQACLTRDDQNAKGVACISYMTNQLPLQCRCDKNDGGGGGEAR